MDPSATETSVTAVRPVRLFLDTNHLIEIERLRSGNEFTKQSADDAKTTAYRKLNARLSTGAVALVFDLHVPLEWVDRKGTEKRAKEIARVVDSYPVRYDYDLDKFIWLREVLDECKRTTPKLQVPDFPILQCPSNGDLRANIFAILDKCVPGFFQDTQVSERDHTTQVKTQTAMNLVSVHFGSVLDCVEAACRVKTNSPNRYRERVLGHRAAFDNDSRELHNRKDRKFNKNDVATWLRKYLRVDRILSALNPGVDVDSVLSKVDISRCPGTHLFLKTREMRLRDYTTKRKDSDVGDWSYVPILSYVDVALIEKNLRTYVIQADRKLEERVFAQPIEAAEAIENLLTGKANLTPLRN
jgi:hypothetical protein